MARQGAKALIAGFVQARPDGRLTVGCYVYDIDKGRELGRTGFVASTGELEARGTQMLGPRLQGDHRFARHVRHPHGLCCRDGTGGRPVKRIAVMDSDGYNHNYVTPGGTTVLTPRLSPKGGRLAYVSFAGRRPAGPPCRS